MAMGFIVILFCFHFGQQTVDQLGEVGGGIVGSLLHLIVRELLLHACRHVGDAADGADAHAHVLGGDRLDDRAHADGIGAHVAKDFDLGGGLILRTCHLDHYASVGGDVLLFGDGLDDRDHVLVIDPAHIGKALAQLVNVLAEQR